MGVGGDIAVGMANQNQIAIALQLVAGVSDDAVFGGLHRRALGHRDVDAVIGLAVGLGAVGGDDTAAHRPAEGRQRAGGIRSLDRGFRCGDFLGGRGGLGETGLLHGFIGGDAGRGRGHHRAGGGCGHRSRCPQRRRRRAGNPVNGGHRDLAAELQAGIRCQAIGAGQIGDRHIGTTGNAHQRIAAIDEVNRSGGRCGRGSGDRHRTRRSGGHGGHGRSALARNHQALARRQRARALVAIGLQNCGRRHVVATRQRLQRIGGADDDLGTTVAGLAIGRRHRARRDRGRGFDRRGRRRVGAHPAAAAGHRLGGCDGRGRIGLRRRDRRRQRGGLIGRRRVVGRALVLRHLARRRRLRLLTRLRYRTGGITLPAETARLAGLERGILRQPRLHVGAAAGKTDRHQRQHRDLRGPAGAKQLDNAGHGLLTHTQQKITLMNKHCRYYQAFNPAGRKPAVR